MKSKIFYACLFAASVLTSCSDFLEEKPKGVLSGDVYFSAVQDFDLAANSLYEKINQTQSWTNPMYPQWQGDDMTANPASNKQAVAALDAFSSDGGNKGVTDAWNLHYNMIKAANFIIEVLQRPHWQKNLMLRHWATPSTGVLMATSTSCACLVLCP